MKLDASAERRARPAPEPVIMIPAVMEGGRLEPIEKMEAHRAGQLHLAVSVFVHDAAGRLLVQRRAASKYHCPGEWANTACTHPHWGEPPAAAARRRLREELGFELELTERRTVDYRAEVGNGLIEHERVTLYTARVDAEPTIAPDPDEVDATRWVAPADLLRHGGVDGEPLTPWFRIYLDRFADFDTFADRAVVD